VNRDLGNTRQFQLKAAGRSQDENLLLCLRLKLPKIAAMDSHNSPHAEMICKLFCGSSRGSGTSRACLARPGLAHFSGIIGLSRNFIHSQEEITVSESKLFTQPSEFAAGDSRIQRPLRIALFGFGTVASSVARILVESRPEGLELTYVYVRSVAKRRADWVPSSVTWSESADEVLASDADVVVELAGGLDPAGGWVRKALSAGKSVVTANKKLIAFQGVELERLAAANGGHLKYGAAVAGGIPVIPGLEQGLAGDRIERIEGILNGTCNFILSKMEEGAEYAPVLAEAQAKGYAEADPTEDVGGFDARAKLAILMRLALRVAVNPEEIVPQQITSITAVDFSYARDLGCTIRQVARADRTHGQIAATVGPTLVAVRSPLAWSRGTENMVVLTGQYGGDVVFSGHGAGGQPTAVAVVSDLLALAHGSRRVELPTAPARVSGEFEVPHYIRFLVDDRPGIVAEITGALAKEKINIRAIVQKPGYPQHALPFVVTVEPCTSSALRRALNGIRGRDYLLEEPLDLQMLV
jgi:homoserine dehydrogenase